MVGYIIDENGDQLKVLYPSKTPVLVDSDTSTIIIPATVWMGGLSAYTYTFDITNEDGYDVTSEITFTSNDDAITVTGGTNGRILTAVASGTTTCNLVHEDFDPVTHPGASGVTNVIVGTIIVDGDFGPIVSGTTITSAATYDISTNWTSNGQILPFNISSYSVSEQIATLDFSTGVITPTATGTTVINITDEASGFDSSTGFTLNISVPGWINIDTSPLIFDAAGTDGKRLVEFSSEVQVETTGMFGVSAEADIEEDPDNLGTYFLMWGAEQNDTGGKLTGTITISLIDDPTVFVTINAEQESI